MQPIQTVYKGYRFRSRLEARWAVFLDGMGIKWEYEKEGYLLDDGTKYLPDFWLSECHSWLEVKPSEFTHEEVRKCTLLAKTHPVIMVSGSPEPKSYEQLINPDHFHLGSLPIFLFYHNDDHDAAIWENTGRVGEKSQHETLITACLKAKQARFEHGEKGF